MTMNTPTIIPEQLFCLVSLSLSWLRLDGVALVGVSFSNHQFTCKQATLTLKFTLTFIGEAKVLPFMLACHCSRE